MITHAQFLEMQARCNPPGADAPDAAACEHESKLHEQILEECQRREWLVIHARMDRPTTTAKGVPDFCIYRQGGKSLFIEAKAGNKKPTDKQLAFRAWALKLGHHYFVVRSFERFMEIVRGLE